MRNKMYRILLLLVIWIVPSVFGQGYKLIWSDEFNGTQLDATNWTRETGGDGWGNSELEYYTNRDVNASVADGILTIKAQIEAYGNRNYTSACLKTQDKRFFKYGKIEARMKLPYGQGIWPAFWMLGQNITTVSWPACGEIDIMELIGGGAGRDNVVYGTGHWDNNGHQSYGLNYTLPSGNFSDAFHTFSIIWEPQKIDWYVDDIKYCSLPITADYLSEFRENAFIILNLAVGGAWPGVPNSSTVFPQTLQVDYVRVYADTLALPSVTVTSPENNSQFAAGGNILLRADASAAVDAVKSVEFYQGSVKIGETFVKPYELMWRGVQAGCYIITAKAITDRGFSNSSSTINVKVGDACGKAPYKGYLQKIPGKIEGENFDLGGNTVGYYDLDATNNGVAYRTSEGVDIQACSDTGAGYNIAWINAGEWLSYSVKVDETALYDFDFRLATAASTGGDISASIDGVDVTGLVHITNTGGLQKWATASKKNVSLTAGLHTLKILFGTSGYNFNYLTVSKSAKPVFITVTYPNGGEALFANTIDEIRWNSSKVDRVKIGYSTDGGSFWTYITPDFPAEFGTCRFVVPASVSSNCKVMIVDKQVASTSDMSDAPFSVWAAAGVKDEHPKGYDVVLYPVYPNPSNPSATVRFTIPSGSASNGAMVQLLIYDITGQLVAAPVNQFYQAGTHEISLNNQNLSSGMYEVILRTGTQTEHSKMVILK